MLRLPGVGFLRKGSLISMQWMGSGVPRLEQRLLEGDLALRERRVGWLAALTFVCGFIAGAGAGAWCVLPSRQQAHPNPTATTEEELKCAADASASMQLRVDLPRLDAQHAMALSAMERNQTRFSIPLCKGQAEDCFIPPSCLGVMLGIMSNTLRPARLCS